MCIKGGNKRRTYLVPLDLTLGVVLKVTIALESVLYDFAELLRKSVVIEEMVDAEPRTRRFRGVGRTNALLGGADARPTELNFLEPVDDLVEVEDKMGAVGDEETAGAIKA